MTLSERNNQPDIKESKKKCFEPLNIMYTYEAMIAIEDLGYLLEKYVRDLITVRKNYNSLGGVEVSTSKSPIIEAIII